MIGSGLHTPTAPSDQIRAAILECDGCLGDLVPKYNALMARKLDSPHFEETGYPADAEGEWLQDQLAAYEEAIRETRHCKRRLISELIRRGELPADATEPQGEEE